MHLPNSTSQFYRGLIADLYEPLVSERARADDYIPFLEHSGTPALELGCGTGLPLVELVERGYNVEGLDSSKDMLEKCREKAKAVGLEVILHHQEMQNMTLSSHYRSIFLAGATFTLLSNDDARKTLRRIYEHLIPGGSVLIPLEIPDERSLRKMIGRFKELKTRDGYTLRVGMMKADIDTKRRTYKVRLRYERIDSKGNMESIERDWLRSWWPQDMFEKMLSATDFLKIKILKPQGGKVDPNNSDFIFLARK